MPHEHSHGERFIVYDDVLDDAQVEEARKLFVTNELTPTISPINRYHDGFAFKGPGPLGHLKAADLNAPQSDLIAHLAVMCIKALYPDWVKDAHTWRYSCTYMVYCAGTQLSWHEDGDGHDGVFNYYLDHWEGHWGGELDLIDCDAGLLFATIDPLEVAVLRSPLNATSVFPRANRMTVMHAQTPHRVRRVDPLAGSHLRRAISGSVACLGDSRHDSLH